MALPVVHYLKNEVRTEINFKILKGELNRKGLQTFSADHLLRAKWNDNKEFSLNGNMYDVVKTKFINGKKIYYCFQDKKETKIVNIETKIEDFFSNSISKNAQIRTYVVHFVSINSVSKVADNSLLHQLNDHYLISKFHTYKLSSETSGFIDKVIIPPEV